MCAPVRFRYRCGCAEDVRFECAGAHRARHRDFPPVITWLDEYCHDCDAAWLAAATVFLRMVLGGGEEEEEDGGGDEGVAGAAGAGGGRGSGNAGVGARVLRELNVNVPARPLPTALDSSGSFGSLDSSGSRDSSVSVDP